MLTISCDTHILDSETMRDLENAADRENCPSDGGKRTVVRGDQEEVRKTFIQY